MPKRWFPLQRKKSKLVTCTVAQETYSSERSGEGLHKVVNRKRQKSNTKSESRVKVELNLPTKCTTFCAERSERMFLNSGGRLYIHTFIRMALAYLHSQYATLTYTQTNTFTSLFPSLGYSVSSRFLDMILRMSKVELTYLESTAQTRAIVVVVVGVE